MYKIDSSQSLVEVKSAVEKALRVLLKHD